MLRFMRVGGVSLIVGAAVAVGLAGCGGDSPQEVDPHARGRLVVSELHRTPANAPVYIEGAVQFVELTRRGEPGPAVKLRLGDKPIVRSVEPGDYRAVSYTRSCSAACSSALDEPVDHCARTLSIEPGERTALRVVTVVNRSCKIEA